MIPSPDPIMFALVELVLALPVIAGLAIHGWWERRVARRAADQSTADDPASQPAHHLAKSRTTRSS